MHNFDVKYQNFVYAIMTNKELTDDERSKIIAEFMNDFSDKYPDLADTATKKDLNETELRLIKEIKEVEVNGQKEIEKIRLDIKEVESNAQKGREEIKSSLTKEIEKIRLEIKEVEFNAQKEREQIRADLMKEINQVRVDLTKEINQVRVDLTKEINQVRVDLTKEIEKTNIKIETIKSDTLKWMFVMMIGQIFAISGIIIAIFKFFK